MENYKIYCAGKFIETSKALKVNNPFTGKVFASTFQAGEKELEEAINTALGLQRTLREIPSYKKFEILKYISETIKSKRERLAIVLASESGKPYRYAMAEIDRASQTFLNAAEECKRLPKEYMSLDWTPAGENKEGIVKYFPIGLVAGIAPFNFPMNLAVHKIAPAIASGCPIILKPASSTPISTLELARILDETDLPKGAVSILPMSREDGNQLVTDERVKLLSFTGSPLVGWKMKRDAGDKKVILELGGNAAVIVADSADLDNAVKKSLVSGFAYSGQICIHAQRFFVHENLFADFTERMVNGAKKLKYGDPIDPETEISIMIDQANADRVEEWVNEAIQKGAQVLLGGNKNNIFYPVTILTNTNNKMKVCSEEVFGPVITIEKFSNFSQAVDMVNDSAFGLQAGVFTNNFHEIDYAFNNLEVGGVILNDVPSFRVDHMPYGGVKNSGLGREGVKYSIIDMMESRILVK